MVKLELCAAIAAGVCLLTARTPAGAQTPAHAQIEDVMALRQLGTSRAGLALSPDRNWLAVFEQETDLAANDIRYRLLLIRPDGASPPRAIGDGGGIVWHDENGRRSGAPIDRFVRWSPDSESVAYLKPLERRVELWRSFLDGRQQRLASLPGDIRDFAWLDPHRVIVLEATPRALLENTAAANFTEGYRLSDDLDMGYSQTPKPDVLRQSQLLVIDTTNGASHAASEAEASALSPPPASAPAWIAPRDPNASVAEPAQGLYAHASIGAPILCADSACTGMLRDAGVLSDGRIWFLRGEGFNAGDVGTYVWSPTSHSVRRLRSSDELLYGCNGGNNEIFCLWETPAHPRRIVAINAETGALRILYDPNPVWNAGAQPRIERISFTDERGLQSYAHLVYPHGFAPGRRYPMVIVQYRSRGFLKGGTGGEYPIFAYASRGYFVMSVERPEGHAQAQQMSQQAFDHLLNFEGEEERMKLASLDGLIAEVERRGLVDDNRIALTGMSDGAETLYWAIGHRRFAAAVASNPATDVSNYWLIDAHFRQQLLAQGISSPWPRLQGWWLENAPVFYADRIATPLLINLSQSEAIYGPPLQVRLRELNVPVETYLYPDAFHIKSRPSQLLAAQRRAMAWIDYWLRGQMEEDPADPGRAQRWGLMRQTMSSAQTISDGEPATHTGAH